MDGMVNETPDLTPAARGGVLVLRPWRERTPVMISGEGRSGTTGMARALRAGGILTFYPEDAANAEEPLFSAAWGARDLRTIHTMRTVWEAQSGGWRRWAVKVPCASIMATWPKLRGAWPGDWLIMVRDPLARCGYGLNLAAEVSRYMAVVASAEALALAGHGVTLVSYEKLITAPERVLVGLGLGLDVMAARREIILGDPRYRPEGLTADGQHDQSADG